MISRIFYNGDVLLDMNQPIHSSQLTHLVNGKNLLLSVNTYNEKTAKAKNKLFDYIIAAIEYFYKRETSYPAKSDFNLVIEFHDVTYVLKKVEDRFIDSLDEYDKSYSNIRQYENYRNKVLENFNNMRFKPSSWEDRATLTIKVGEIYQFIKGAIPVLYSEQDYEEYVKLHEKLTKQWSKTDGRS